MRLFRRKPKKFLTKDDLRALKHLKSMQKGTRFPYSEAVKEGRTK